MTPPVIPRIPAPRRGNVALDIGAALTGLAAGARQTEELRRAQAMEQALQGLRERGVAAQEAGVGFEQRRTALLETQDAEAQRRRMEQESDVPSMLAEIRRLNPATTLTGSESLETVTSALAHERQLQETRTRTSAQDRLIRAQNFQQARALAAEARAAMQDLRNRNSMLRLARNAQLADRMAQRDANFAADLAEFRQRQNDYTFWNAKTQELAGRRAPEPQPGVEDPSLQQHKEAFLSLLRSNRLSPAHIDRLTDDGYGQYLEGWAEEAGFASDPATGNFKPRSQVTPLGAVLPRPGLPAEGVAVAPTLPGAAPTPAPAAPAIAERLSQQLGVPLQPTPVPTPAGPLAGAPPFTPSVLASPAAPTPAPGGGVAQPAGLPLGPAAGVAPPTAGAARFVPPGGNLGAGGGTLPRNLADTLNAAIARVTAGEPIDSVMRSLPPFLNTPAFRRAISQRVPNGRR